MTEQPPRRPPRRRAQRRDHLDASAIPVELALRERAKTLNERGTAMLPGFEADTLLAISAEFLALAEEIHFW